MCSKHYFTLLYIYQLLLLLLRCSPFWWCRTVLYCTSPTLVGLSCCRELKGRLSVALVSLLETTNKRKALQRKLYNWGRNKIKSNHDDDCWWYIDCCTTYRWIEWTDGMLLLLHIRRHTSSSFMFYVCGTAISDRMVTFSCAASYLFIVFLFIVTRHHLMRVS